MTIKRGQGKLKTDYGMRDYHRWYNKNNKFKVDRTTYSDIVSEMNLFIRDLIIDSPIDYMIPARIGELGIRKEKREPKIVNGEVINNAPADWGKTLKLWKNDPEAKAKKIVIKHTNSHTNGYVFRVYYKKAKGNYKNKMAFYFDTARAFSRKINDRINDYSKSKFDSVLLYKRT